jgi:serine/threonine protein kinase
VGDDGTPSGGVGTLQYAAPEMYQDEVPWTTKCDVFSFGLVLYEILTKKPVFHPSELPLPIIRRLRTRDLPDLPLEHGPLMQDLIRKCWESDPEKRPSFHEIFTGFKAANFGILPSADRIRIGEFCTAVLEWERKAGINI